MSTTKKPMRKKVWFTLRSGHVIKLTARNVDLTMVGGKLTAYSWDGMPLRTWYFWRRRPLYIDPSEVVAVEVRGG